MFFVYRFDVFTSPCELQLFGASKTVCDTTAATVLRRSKQLEAKYSFFDPNSFLSSINNRHTNKVKIDKETHDILKALEPLMASTNYVFDIAYAGTLKECFKLESIEAMERRKEELLPFADHTHYELSKTYIAFSNPHTKIDLGGVIKEYAVDEAAKTIRQAKIKHALINFGGDISVVGAKPNGETWKIGIKNPQNPSVDLFAVELDDTSLATSGHYERSISIENENFSHVMPRTESKSDILQASVIHKSAMTAGVFSTALLLQETVSIPKGANGYLINSDLNVTSI